MTTKADYVTRAEFQGGSKMTGEPEYFTATEPRPWVALLRAELEFDRVIAELLPVAPKVGARSSDLEQAATVLQARALMAGVEALHLIRQQLTSISNSLATLAAK
jgi:hypothetical protein